MTTKMTVASFIAAQIECSEKTQAQIAQEVGFEKPNIITMIKQGKTKLPLAKIGLMARALGVDPVYLFRLTIEEYLPDTAEAIEGVFRQPLLSAAEVEVIHAYRNAAAVEPRAASPT